MISDLPSIAGVGIGSHSSKKAKLNQACPSTLPDVHLSDAGINERLEVFTSNFKSLTKHVFASKLKAISHDKQTPIFKDYNTQPIRYEVQEEALCTQGNICA